jgi:hypothetical protein
VLTRVFALQKVTTDGKKEPSVEKTQNLVQKDKHEVEVKSAKDGAYPDAEVIRVPALFSSYF